MLNFAWPWMILFLPLPWLIILVFKHLANTKSNTPAINFPKVKQLQQAYSGAQRAASKLLRWQMVVISLAWICLVVSLMRPEYVKDLVYANNQGYDLLLAVDLSRSMEIPDFATNSTPMSRIEATKKVVANFVEQRKGDRVGLIVFAEQAYLIIPLTLDTPTVSKLLNNLLIGMAGERTAIGDAIGIGVQNLRSRPQASRVLILLTDGEDTASHIPPLEAAKIAAQNNIKIYTVGVGDKLDEKLLKQISELTQGHYYKVTDVAALEQVYQEIDQLEKSEAKQKVLLIKTPLYHGFLLFALMGVLLVIAFNSMRYGAHYEFN